MASVLFFLKSLFRCAACVARDTENAFLRSELVAIRQDMNRVQRECADRVMARSYTEYAVGTAASEPSQPPQGRSDEEEWLIEQRKKAQLDREVQEAMRSGEGEGSAG